MPISSGNRIGPYEILEPLGSGGMGQVFRARDSRLGRDVAFKVLHRELLDSPDGLRRFESEARTASSLNHPNIVTIHDVGRENGEPYIVTEFIDGQPLRAHLRGRPLPTRELLNVAVQIADGLAAAHDAGISHRDLKPENVILTRDMRAKIVDFGLAKPYAAPPIGRDGSTGTMTLSTAPGVVLGTVPYMSPEQVRGLPADYRSDQFSFGCLLYEMATGKRPFDRPEGVATLAAIINEDPPPVSNVNPQLPIPLVWVINRSLEKDPARRYASTTDLFRALTDIREHATELPPAGHAASVAPERPRSGRMARIAIPVFAVAGLLALAAPFLPDRDGSDTPAVRFTPFATEAADEAQPAWSPDGQTLAYVAVVNDVAQVFTKSLNAAAPAQITRSSTDCAYPSWSPDGKRVYYLASGSVWAVGATGGSPEPVIDRVPGSRRTPTYAVSPDSRSIFFFRMRPPGTSWLYVARIGVGDPQPVRRPPLPETFRFPHGVAFSPDGTKLAVGIIPEIGPQSGFELWILPLPDGTPSRIPAEMPRDARPVNYSWMPDNRRLVLSMEADEGSGFHLYELDTHTGDVRALTSGAGQEQYPFVSRDGRTLAYASGGTDWDLMEVPLDVSAISAVLSTSRTERLHAWSPAGTHFAYVSSARGVSELWIRGQQEEYARLLATRDESGSLFRATPRFSPDGRRVSFNRIGPKHLVWIAHVAGGPAVPLEQETDDQHGSAWSPDGNWIAYCRFIGGKWQLARAPSGGGRAIPIIEGCDADAPVDWSRTGDAIAYADAGGLHVVSPEGKDHRRIVAARPVSFVFAQDGANIHVLRGSLQRGWQLATLSARDGSEVSSNALPVPSRSEACCLSLHPDGKRIGLSVGITKRDIWLLERLDRRTNWLARLFRRP
jgi:Tol biopolymer transport system component